MSPKNLKTVRTIKINNGTLVAKIDPDDKIHWFRNNEEMTPNQIKTYKYYDPKIKNYRRLGNINGRVNRILYLVKDSVVSPIYTPSIDKITDIYRANRKNKMDLNKKQAVPFNGEYITLKTKGNMNLAGGAGYVPPTIDISKTKQSINKRLYRTISPLEADYSLLPALQSFLSNKEHDDTRDGVNEVYPVGTIDAIWAKYLQVPEKDRKYSDRLEKSSYRPSKGNNSDNYYKLPLQDYEKESLVDTTRELPLYKNKVSKLLNNYALGEHTVGRGYDNRGEYVSYFDVFDINPFNGKYRGINIPIVNKLDDIGIGKPVRIYDRIYLDDYYGVKEPTHATYLPEIIVTGKKKQGGKMNIIEFLQKGTPKNGITVNKTVPEITVVPNKLYLRTHYPVLSKDFPLTGHSEIDAYLNKNPRYDEDDDRVYVDAYRHTYIDKLMSDDGYNLVTNNCADATRCALEDVSGKKMNPYFFTTPGDVLDFFKKNFDVRKDLKRSKVGTNTYYTNISEADFEKIRELHDLQLFANKLRRLEKQLALKKLALNKEKYYVK